MKLRKIHLCLFLVFMMFSLKTKSEILFYGNTTNDLYQLLQANNIPFTCFSSIDHLVKNVKKGDAVIITSPNYPDKTIQILPEHYEKLQQLKVRIFIEYPEEIPNHPIDSTIFRGLLERGVVNSGFFGDELPPMSIFSVNDCHIRMTYNVKDTLLCYAKVAGFDHAEYGLTNTTVYPLLFRDQNILIAATCLSNFSTSRFAPQKSLEIIWGRILNWLTDETLLLEYWVQDPKPMYGKNEVLRPDAILQSIKNGYNWYYASNLLLDPSWEDEWIRYQGDGTNPFGPPIGNDKKRGDGSHGILEGHASRIYHDGTQQYRYWMRADVQAESAMAMAAGGQYLHQHDSVSANLLQYLYKTSNLRNGPRNDPSSPSYGLIGWAVTHPYVFYGDDNARTLLGTIGATAFLNNQEWNLKIVEGILSNFRVSGKHGFQGERFAEGDLVEKGLAAYRDAEIIHLSAHFESWLWANYLWLYQQTHYAPLLEKAKASIATMMDNYPHNWRCVQGIQIERARMILPLAWLVRIEDTEEHRAWLDRIISDILAYQVSSGGIRESFEVNVHVDLGKTVSNDQYGVYEAPLIFNEGDPVTCSLYTSNFAIFGLNEAYHATHNPEYREARDKLVDYLIRIQVKSDRHKDISGAWFRGFDYNRWDYWGSNADAGWGVWSTLSGWSQPWILLSLIMIDEENNFWDFTHRQLDVKNEMSRSLWITGD